MLRLRFIIEPPVLLAIPQGSTLESPGAWEDVDNLGASKPQCLTDGLWAQKTKLKHQDSITHKAGDSDEMLKLSGS